MTTGGGGLVRRVVLVIVVVCALLAVGYSIWKLSGQAEPASASDQRTFADASFNPPRPFKVTLHAGMTIPITSPLSQKQTGYPAELCYWTKDGQPKTEPTAVLLNETLGKEGPTFCPDCGRLVVPHNPAAAAGAEPPPTQSEYLALNPASQPTTAPTDR